MPDITDFGVDEMTPNVFDEHIHLQEDQHQKEEGEGNNTNQQPPPQSKHYMDIVQLIVNLTSPEKIDYDLVSDLFLTYRSFLSSSTLLQLLILRFKWAIQCFDDISHQERHIEGEKVLVRAFTVIRHWLLNYFKDDFASSTQLRLLFVNYFTRLSHSDFAVQRIIDNLHKTYSDQNKRSIHGADQSPQYRNSVILNSINDRVIPNIPMQYSKRDPKLFLNPKNSNLRLSQAIAVREESPLFISLNKSPITRNVVTQTTAFPTNSALSKIIPPTPVKKMDVIVKLPTPQHSSASSSPSLKNDSKGLKSLIDKWTNTFNTNKHTINKDIQVEKFMRKVVSLPKLNDKELEQLIVGKFDILSARTIDQVEYLFKFQNELFNKHSDTVFGRDSFSFTVEDDINKSNIDNMNLYGYVSNLSKSVVSLQQQLSEKSYVTYDSDLSRNNTSVSREFDFESMDDNLQDAAASKTLRKVDTIEEFNKHFSALSQSTRNIDSIPSDLIVNSRKSTPLNEEVKQTLKSSSTEETIKNLISTPSKTMKTSSTEETLKNLIEEPNNEQIVEKRSSEVHDDEEVKNATDTPVIDNMKDISQSAAVDSTAEENEEVPDLIVDSTSPISEQDAAFVVESKTVESSEIVSVLKDDEQELKQPVINPQDSSESVDDDEFNFVEIQSPIQEQVIITIPAASTDSDDEIDDVVSLYSQNSETVKSPTKSKGAVDRKSVILRSMNTTTFNSHTDSHRDSRSTFGSDSFMSSYDEPIQDTMSTNNVSDALDEPNTPTMHQPTPHVSPIKSIVENQEFEKSEMRFDLNRIPSFTNISNSYSSLTSINNKYHSVARDSYLSNRSKNLHVSFHSDMISTSSIFTPVKGRPKFVDITVAQDHQEIQEDSVESIIQQIKVQRDVSLQTVESNASSVPYPGVNKKTLTELADIRDESFHVDPINAALSKLEGTYTRDHRSTSIATSTTSSVLAKQVENLNIQSNPNNKRRSFFIDQRRKTKQFLLTPVPQKDVSQEESNPKILLDLLMNYQITNDNLQLSNSSKHVSFILNYDSKTLANQFTLIEKDALLEIDWSELVELKWNSEEVKQINSWLEILIQNERLNGIDLCISRFNLTVNWIISEILLTKDLNLRKLTIQRFIHIAQNCKTLQNYSTLMQILLALSSDKVQKLKETWRNVEPGDILIFKNLEPILSPMKNFLNLRTELNRMKYSLGAAPFLGLYLSDLLFNKEKKTFKDGKINFSKFQHDAKIIKSLIKCIQWSMLYKLEVDEEVLSKCLYIKSLTEDEMNICLKEIS